MNRTGVIVTLIGFAVVGVLAWMSTLDRSGTLDDPLGAEVAPAIPIEGVVEFDGLPMAGIELELREGTLPVATGRTGADGRYSLAWRPRLSHRSSRLLLVASDPKRRVATTIEPPAKCFELRDAVAGRGVVLRTDGTPVAGARVQLASHGFRFDDATTGDDGTFVVEGLPRGAPIDVYVEADGMAPRALLGFAGGDALTIHMQTGRSVTVYAHDPAGNEVAGATVAPAVAEEFTPAAVAGAKVDVIVTARAAGLVVARASGHIPVFCDAEVQGVADAVLWPAREVTLLVHDGQHDRGVPWIDLEVNLAERDDVSAWNGTNPGNCFREYPLRMGDRRGEFTVTLPRFPVSLRVRADGYGNREIDLDAESTRVVVRMAPMVGRPNATLRVTAPGLKGTLPVIVADPETEWFAAFEAPGEVRIPAGRKLELASAGAAEGFWVPPVPVKAISKGRSRTMRLPLRPAAELIVKPQPPGPCRIEVVDKAYGKAVPALVQVTDEPARFWVRPRRDVEVTVTPEANFREITGEFQVEAPRREWNAYLLPAAGWTARVEDAAGNPIPFARVRYREAGRGGRLETQLGTREHLADATGTVRLFGLRRGPTPLEVVASGFRTFRPRTPELKDGDPEDAGVVRLEPAAVVRGTVRAPDGKPVPRTWLRTLPREFLRLEFAGGAVREVYDASDFAIGDTLSTDDGTFAVPDETPGNGLVVARAFERGDLTSAFVPVEQAGVIELPEAAEVSLSVPSAVEAVYLLLPNRTAVRVFRRGALRMNPVPLTLPAGKVELVVILVNRKSSAGGFVLQPGEQSIRMPKFSR